MVLILKKMHWMWWVLYKTDVKDCLRGFVVKKEGSSLEQTYESVTL